VWVGLIHAFGTVEILEALKYPTWLGVCVDPFHADYLGSLVVVRQSRSGTLFVLASDNAGVLWEGDEAAVSEDDDSDNVDIPASDDPTARAFLVRIHSYKHGNTTVDVNARGVIVNAAGEYGDYYVGMDFYHFIREFKKADKGMTYRRVRQ
jgi:hypothetical protein